MVSMCMRRAGASSDARPLPAIFKPLKRPSDVILGPLCVGEGVLPAGPNAVRVRQAA